MLLKTVVNSTRPAFLILAPICVFLGLSTAIASQSQIDLWLFIIILIGATLAHASVNLFNEYFDFKSGLDLKTEKTPFSGGSGALPNNPSMAQAVLIAGILSLTITLIIGAYLAFQTGLKILPFGVAGVLLIITYTQWLNRLPLVCLVSPGLGFGVLMVVGTHTLLSGNNTDLPWLVSLVPFLLINNLLLLNQYPDVKADASVGRKTFPIAFGIKNSNLVHAIFFILAYASIVMLITTGWLPKLSFIAVIPIVFSCLALFGAIKHTSNIGHFPKYLAANVVAAITTPLLLAMSIIYGL